MAAGFAGFALLQAAVASTFGIELSAGLLQTIGTACLFGPSLLRRKLFGPPQLPPLRTGLLARIGSVAGLLCLFFGMGVSVVVAHRLSLPAEVPPSSVHDSAAHGSAAHGAAGEFAIDFGEAGETAEEASARRAIERAALEQEASEELAEGLRHFAEHEAYQRNLSLKLGALALGLFGLGSGLLRARFK